MNDEILKECRQAKERLAALFGDVDALMDFMMKRREPTNKKGDEVRRFLTLSQKEAGKT